MEYTMIAVELGEVHNPMKALNKLIGYAHERPALVSDQVIAADTKDYTNPLDKLCKDIACHSALSVSPPRDNGENGLIKHDVITDPLLATHDVITDPLLATHIIDPCLFDPSLDLPSYGRDVMDSWVDLCPLDLSPLRIKSGRYKFPTPSGSPVALDADSLDYKDKGFTTKSTSHLLKCSTPEEQILIEAREISTAPQEARELRVLEKEVACIPEPAPFFLLPMLVAGTTPSYNDSRRDVRGTAETPDVMKTTKKKESSTRAQKMSRGKQNPWRSEDLKPKQQQKQQQQQQQQEKQKLPQLNHKQQQQQPPQQRAHLRKIENNGKNLVASLPKEYQELQQQQQSWRRRWTPSRDHSARRIVCSQPKLDSTDLAKGTPTCEEKGSSLTIPGSETSIGQRPSSERSRPRVVALPGKRALCKTKSEEKRKPKLGPLSNAKNVLWSPFSKRFADSKDAGGKQC